jgi:uncharacterized protein
MKILLAGGTGFLGREVYRALSIRGHQLHLVSHRPVAAMGIPVYRYGDSLPAMDAVINLAGESVAGYWTMGKKKRILDSRIAATKTLVEAMLTMHPRPKVFISSSAIGFYGDRPGVRLTEESMPDPARRFRWVVCDAWEKEALQAQKEGIRTVIIRWGQILHPEGGLLGHWLPFYRKGVCVGFGRPSNAFSWITRSDAVALIAWVLEHEVSGALNGVSPHATTLDVFTGTLAACVGKPRLGFIPPAMVRVLFGELSAALIDDQRVVPQAALGQGFQFNGGSLDDEMRRMMGGKHE